MGSSSFPVCMLERYMVAAETEQVKVLGPLTTPEYRKCFSRRHLSYASILDSMVSKASKQAEPPQRPMLEFQIDFSNTTGAANQRLPKIVISRIPCLRCFPSPRAWNSDGIFCKCCVWVCGVCIYLTDSYLTYACELTKSSDMHNKPKT